MHPLTPYLKGLPHPQGRRLAGLQRCLRTTDLDEVGDDTHLTVLWRADRTWTLGQLPTWLIEHTLAQFGQDPGSGPVRDVLAGEEQRFARLLTRGRQVLARFGPGRPPTEADLAYLH
jgi:hypothetical protein